MEFKNGTGVSDPIKKEHFYGADHPEFAQYLTGEHGLISQVPTDYILDEWVDMPVYSKGFGDCLPLIALKDKKVQMIHRGLGLFSIWGDSEIFSNKVSETLLDWKESQSKVTVLKAERTRHLNYTLSEMTNLFGDKYQFIDFKIDSMFDVVVDPKKNLLLVQFMRTKEFRKYNI